MIMHRCTSVLLCAIIILIIGCNKNETSTPKEMQSPTSRQMPSIKQGGGPTTTTSAAGIEWKLPEGWSIAGQRPMRIATYTLPASGNTEGAECAVFYFGSGEGGDIDANISRWAGQFENPDGPERQRKTVNGMEVTMVTITGTYLAPGGPMMQSQGKKPDYKLRGAIVNAPNGSVFFKLTGPVKTVDGAEDDFMSLIGSMSKQSSSI